MTILLTKRNFSNRLVVLTIRQEVLLRIIVNLLILCGVMLSAACQGISSEPGVPEVPLTESVPISTAQGSIAITSTLPLSNDPALQARIDKAITDLAQRLSISVSEITLVEATPVVWPDVSLGCPQPGMGYAQVPQDGLLIRLQAGGQLYEYHGGGMNDPFLCVQATQEPSPLPPIDLLTPSPENSTPATSPASDNSTPTGEGQ
jgi:hypothetical protein